MKYSLIAAPANGAMYCIDAELDAVAHTTVVYSIAPCAWSLETISATAASFWPMAT